MKRIACGFLAVLALAGKAAPAQGQRRTDGDIANSPQYALPTALPSMLMSGRPTPPVPGNPGGMVSAATLAVPEAARKEMLKFAKDFDAGRLEESAKHAERALRISPDWAAAHHDLGQCYARMHQYEKAIGEFHTAAELDTRIVAPWVSLAGAYFLEKKYAEGEISARRALEIDPSNGNAHYFLGRILAAEGRDLENAVELLRKSVEQYPAAHLALASIYLKQNQSEEAIGELRGYLADPNAPQKEKVTCMVEKLTKPAGVDCVMQ